MPADEIPTILSPGYYKVSKAVETKYGKSLLNALNRGLQPKAKGGENMAEEETIIVSAEFKEWWENTIWSKSYQAEGLIVLAWGAWEASRKQVLEEVKEI